MRATATRKRFLRSFDLLGGRIIQINPSKMRRRRQRSRYINNGVLVLEVYLFLFSSTSEKTSSTMHFSSILPGLITTLSFAVGIDAWAQVRKKQHAFPSLLV